LGIIEWSCKVPADAVATRTSRVTIAPLKVAKVETQLAALEDVVATPV
jgi:hypothetical protein